MSTLQVAISDFCETGSGTTPSRQKMELYYGGSIPWVKSGELKEKEIIRTEECVTDIALKETSLKMVPKGALLVAMYGATVGRVGYLGVDATTNQAVCHIVPDAHKANNRYLFHALQYKANELISKGVGGAQPNISQGTIKETKIYLPAIKEQKKIASILDQADELRRARRKSIDRLDDLSQAIFYEIFGNPDTNPKGFKKGKIRDLVREVKYGTSQKAHTEKNGFPILRMGNITYGGQLDLSDLKYVFLDTKDIPKYMAVKDDILFNRTNSKELVGKTAVFDIDNPYAIAGYLVRARVNDKADPYYISGYLNSPHGKTILMAMCKNIVGMANINAQEFQDINILIPSIDLQKKYRAAIISINQRRKEIFTALDSLDDLFSSLQQRAFRGEL